MVSDSIIFDDFSDNVCEHDFEYYESTAVTYQVI